MRPWPTPKLFAALRDYNSQTFLSDVVAGVTVGFVALPLAMAFAISSGAAPEVGLYTAVVAGFITSALGGCKTQIGGPSGAFVVIVAGIVAQHGLNGLLICNILAGSMLIVLGLTGLGAAVAFIPRPVVVGFTNGIAVVIASTQIKDALGLDGPRNASDFVSRLADLAAQLHIISAPTVLLTAGSLAVLIGCQRFSKAVPGAVVALLIGTIVVATTGLAVETVGERFGGLAGGLPAIVVPEWRLETIPSLISPAVTIAVLVAIESLMCAVVADRMTGDRHEPNLELAAQGVANIAGALVGGIPAAGGAARTVTNIRSGAKTPVAGLVHAGVLLGVLLFAAPLVRHIPLAVLSAILLAAAYNMGEWREIPKLLKMSWATISVWFATFTLTVFADLTVAVQVGMVLAALLFIRKVASTTTVSLVTKEEIQDERRHALQDKPIPEYVTIIRIHGPFLFGMTRKLAFAVEEFDRLTSVVVLRMRDMTAIDATGVLALEEFADKLQSSGRKLIVCGARPQPASMIAQADFAKRIGGDNICPHITAALARADVLHRGAASA